MSSRSQPAAAPIDTRMARTRDALYAALLALLGEGSFDQITVREITARAGVGYATFFRHYSDKDALLRDLAGDEISALLAMAMPVLDAKGSATSSLTLCRYVAAHDRLWSALLTGGAAGTMRAAFVAAANALPQVQNKQGWLPNDLSVIYGVGGTIDILAWWLRQPERMPVEQVAGILNRLVIAPALQVE